MEKTVIKTASAPKAIGPYEQGIIIDRLIFTSGQIPIDPLSGKMVEGDIRAKTIQVLNNIKAVIEAGGSSIANVIKTTIFLKDLANFDTVNKVYEEYFKDSKPARSCIGVSSLPKDADIEIEAVAYTL